MAKSKPKIPLVIEATPGIRHPSPILAEELIRVKNERFKEEEVVSERELYVIKGDGTCISITVPTNAKITFGPWSPPSMRRGMPYESGQSAGTLRIYGKSKEQIIALIAGVIGFYDSSLEIEEIDPSVAGIPIAPKKGGKHDDHPF